MRKFYNYELKNICIKNNLFTYGSVEQYNKFFAENDKWEDEDFKDQNINYAIAEQYTYTLAVIIFICSNTSMSIVDIHKLLIDEMNKINPGEKRIKVYEC